MDSLNILRVTLTMTGELILQIYQSLSQIGLNDKEFIFVEQVLYSDLYRAGYISLKSAPKASAVNKYTSVFGSRQACGSRPALCSQQ